MSDNEQDLEQATKTLLARSFDHPLIVVARKKLATELPLTLSYHVAAHTDDVMHEALLFALKDGLSPRELELIAIAAAFHDLGFIVRTANNEELAALMASDALKQSGGFTAEEVKTVELMIRDTQLKTTPQGMRQISSSKLSNYLLDGDVSNLGREDFFEKTELVRKEVGVAQKKLFYGGLISFLDAHQWYSEAARVLRDEGKQQNRSKLIEMIRTGNFP